MRASYLDLLNKFYDLVQKKYIPSNTQLLYYTLMQINNDCYWEEWFERTNVVLCGLTHLGEKALTNAKNELKQLGLIEFISSKKRGECTKYKLLYRSNEGTKEVQTQYKGSTKEVQTADIYKIKTKNENKTKKKDTNVSKEIDGLVQQFEEIYAFYPKKQGKEEALRCFIDDVRMGVDIAEIKQGTLNYVNHCKEKGTKDQFICMISNFFSKRRWKDNWTVVESNPLENQVVQKSEVEEDRFACLDNETRTKLENLGVIVGQSLDLGNADDDTIQYLLEKGVL